MIGWISDEETFQTSLFVSSRLNRCFDELDVLRRLIPLRATLLLVVELDQAWLKYIQLRNIDLN